MSSCQAITHNTVEWGQLFWDKHNFKVPENKKT
jgi:hypothetical protein